MPIELLERAIGAIDASSVSENGDPWLYFYEHFLREYDPELRNARGVYFTPVEVVQTQIRLVSELLQTRFNKPLAFADDEVVTLDPAAGTGTYPLAVLDHTVELIGSILGPGAVPEKLTGLADRLFAFEILVGPYAVSHLRLSQRLKDVCGETKQPNVFLTDTLESPFLDHGFRASLLLARLTEERSRAQEVKKRNARVCVYGEPSI